MFAHPQRFIRLDAAGRALLRRVFRVNCDEVRPFALALVLKHPQERPPRRSCPVARVARQFDQALRVQVLNRHEVVLAGVVVRQLVKEVPTLPLEVGVAFGNNLQLFLPIRRAVFLPREVVLCAFESLTFLAEVGTLDGVPVGVVGVLEDSHVDADDPLGILRLLWCILVHVDAERGIPLARGFAFDRDLFDGRVLGDVSVEVNRNLADLAQPQRGPTTRILEFEAGLVVGKRPILPRWFPLEHSHGASILLLCFERGEVVVDALDDHLENFRVDISEVVPPRFEVGESPLHLVAGGDVVCLVEQVEDVVVELPTSIDVVQKLLFEGFWRVESILVVVVHGLFVWVGIGDADDFHVGSAPSFGDDDVGTVPRRFCGSVENFFSFDFKPIHHRCIDFG